MKKTLTACVVFTLSLSLFQLAFAYKGQRSVSGITQGWGTTKFLDELYALKKGWTIVKITRKGDCVFDKASWDEIDGESSLYRDLLREADVNKDNNVTSSEASRLLRAQQQQTCRYARHRNVY